MMQLNNLTFDDDVDTTTNTPEVVMAEGKVNVTQTLWTFIRSKTGISSKGIMVALPDHASGVATRLNQLLKAGKVIRNVDKDGVYKWYAVGDTYPIVYAKGRPKGSINKKPKKVKKPRTYHIPTPAPRTALITTNFNVDNIIKNLTILQAKELRDALNNLFK